MSIEDQKKIADKVLDKLFIVDPYAIVAGGAARDWYFGKEAKDIDVFFYINNKYTIDTRDNLIECLGFELQKVGDTAELEALGYRTNPNINSVYNMLGFETPVQLILMNMPTRNCVIDRFPLSLCKAWYKNSTKGVVLHKDFRDSVKHKALFKTNDLYANGDKYLLKIRDRFPEYKYYSSRVSFLESLV